MTCLGMQYANDGTYPNISARFAATTILILEANETYLVRKIGLGYSGHNSIENGIEEILECLGLDNQDFKKMEELAKNEIRESGGMMELLG